MESSESSYRSERFSSESSPRWFSSFRATGPSRARTRARNRSDAVQPLGLGFCKAFVTTSLFDLTQRTVSERRWMDPKMRLQFCLHEFNATARPPQLLVKRFCLLDNFGPSHERMYVAGCYINDTLVATARGQLAVLSLPRGRSAGSR